MEKAAATEQAAAFVAPAQNETPAKQTVDAMLVLMEAERQTWPPLVHLTSSCPGRPAPRAVRPLRHIPPG